VETDPAAAVAELQAKHGITSLDVVISNAGIADSAVRVSDITADSALEHFRINAVAPMVLFKAVAPLLKESSNPIFVGMSSVFGGIYVQEKLAGMGVPPIMGAYGASKAALNWLVNRLKFEEPWLTSFVFHPGLVETDMTSALATVVDTKAMGAISVEVSVKGMVAVIDGATKEISGTFKKHDGTDLPW
ncbi:aflatoxin biosynthesis ketoreductase Nor-1 (short-chain dehydrogenase), partial [Colletotrichum musicola]